MELYNGHVDQNKTYMFSRRIASEYIVQLFRSQKTLENLRLVRNHEVNVESHKDNQLNKNIFKLKKTKTIYGQGK